MAKYKRKNFFIDKEIQGKYMVTFFVPMLILLALFSALLYFSLSRGIQSTTASLGKGVSEQIDLSMSGLSDPTVQDYDMLLEDINDHIEQYNKTTTFRYGLIKTLLSLIIPGFILIIIQIVVLTIFFSHKLAGPVYRVQLACQRVAKGDLTEKIYLRNGDQLTKLATEFNSMTVALHKFVKALKQADSNEAREKILKKIKI